MNKITVKEPIKIILENLTDIEKEKSIIYWDKKLLEKGDKIKIGQKYIEMPFEGFMVFVDLEPKANWGHPSLYFLININMDDVKIIKEEFPPYSGDYPQSFKVILRYGKVPPHDRYFNVFNE